MPQGKHAILRLTFMAIALAAAACAPLAARFAVPPPLSPHAIRNALYWNPYPAEKQARLTDGLYVEKDEDGGETFRLTATDRWAIGDLDGDGARDAAVVLVSTTGGTGAFFELAVLLNQGGEPRHVASVPLGDRVIVESVIVAGGTVQVTMITHAPEDPLCCPTKRVTRAWRLSNNDLVSDD